MWIQILPPVLLQLLLMEQSYLFIYIYKYLYIIYYYIYGRDSQVAQTVKNLPTRWEPWVQSLGWKDPLEKEMATHSSILAWRTHGQRSLAGYSLWGHRESDTTEHTHVYEIYISICIYGCFCATMTSNLIHEAQNICCQAFYRKSC